MAMASCGSSSIEDLGQEIAPLVICGRSELTQWNDREDTLLGDPHGDFLPLCAVLRVSLWEGMIWTLCLGPGRRAQHDLVSYSNSYYPSLFCLFTYVLFIVSTPQNNAEHGKFCK